MVTRWRLRKRGLPLARRGGAAALDVVMTRCRPGNPAVSAAFVASVAPMAMPPAIGRLSAP
jgi:hypothetical protein